jgi:polysaccharide chain length determinant protein (PEP-CTERM system associated)
MLGHRQITMEDIKGIFRRYWFLLVIPPILGCAAAYLVTFKLANRYESDTLVLVQEQRVPESIVKSLSTSDLGTHLSSMKEQILSRTRLEPIVNQFGLFDSPGATMDERVAELGSKINITPVQAMAETRASGLPGFTIGVTLTDAHKAQEVCRQITNMFLVEDFKSREEQADTITQFLDKQVADAQQRMNDQDAKLAAFKREHFGTLPDQESSNLGLLTTTSSQMDAMSQAIERDEQVKSLQVTMLNSELSAWKATRTTGGGVASPATMDEELRRKEQELAALQEKFTDSWPDVQQKKDEIEQLKKRIAAADAAKAQKAEADAKNKAPDPVSTGPAIEPPNIQQLRAQIAMLEESIKEKNTELKKLQQQSDTYQARIQSSPAVEEEYKELTRDFATAQNDYNELLHGRNASAMSADLQRRQQGEQFKLLDPASLPDSPSFPVRWKFAAAGLGGGFGLGAVLVLVFEMKDKSIRTEGDIETLLKLPTLAMVPSIESKQLFGGRLAFKAKGNG